jgi:hypothetical protein
MSLQQAKIIIEDSIYTLLMDTKNISNLIIDYTVPQDFIIRITLNNKIHDFTYDKFLNTVQNKPNLINNIINSGICSLQILKKSKSNFDKETFGFSNLQLRDEIYFNSKIGYNNRDEFITFLNIFKEWNYMNKI